ncbi:MAG TPA: DUF5916 domain-containing protein [Bacteroidota bacterium]|nr:DUF5916 domain-containing protein [Bacteroidota bacterium]
MNPRPLFFALLALVVGALILQSPTARAGNTHSPFSSPLISVDTLRPMRVNASPVIDGDLNEPFWRLAPNVTGFKTFIPDFDKIPDEQTEVAMAYDDENLYFAFRCYDDITKIKSSVSPRDKMLQDDFICINLDSFNDQQGLNAFYVNPLGIQGDSRFAANNEDFSPDFVWYSAGKIDSVGYTIEVQLPLKSLRYANDDPTVMGVVFERYIRRRDEHSSFPRLDPAKGLAFLTQMFPISYPTVEHYALWELLPAVTATRQDIRQGTNLVRDKQEAEISLTAKYGITSDLILDGTVNPDFSQVESDAGQVDVNLRYSLYYAEKRPFFLEGQDNYTTSVTANTYDPLIFYSRTIADPVFGTKLTGKIGKENTLAVLYAMDNVLEQDRSTLGRYVHTPIIRYKRSLSDDSYVGLLYTGRELENSNNRVIGYDEMYRVSDAAVLSSTGFVSSAKDVSSPSSITGHTFGTRFASSTRDLDYNLNFREVSEDFRADMGFLTRTGLLNFIGFISPKLYPHSDFFQKVSFELSSGQTKDIPSGLWETTNDLAFNIFFGGTWLWRTRLNYSTEVFDNQTFQTSGIHSQIRGQITKQLYTNLLYRRIRSIFYDTPEQGKSNVVNASMTLQPSDNLSIEASYTFTDFAADAGDVKLFDYSISRGKITYQVNQYLFFRTIAQYNDFRKDLSTEFLASFTYIPGTVVYLGYGSIYDKVRWNGTSYAEYDGFLEMRRGLFMKMSYLWRS